MPRNGRWKMAAPCANCPFSATGPGRELRRSLRGGRLREILRGLRRGGHFVCHKTTPSTGDGSNLLCAGSLDWQHKQGIHGQYEQICERLDAMREDRQSTI